MVAIYLPSDPSRTPAHLSVRPASQVKPGAKLMKFRPLHDRIVIRRVEGEDKTKGGIIIPDTASNYTASRWQFRLRESVRYYFCLHLLDNVGSVSVYK
jgi:Chaperonin 10 Kd subunit